MNRKSYSLLLGAVLAVAVNAQESLTPAHCDQFVPYGYPTLTVKEDTTPLCRIAYFTLHDNSRKVPVYSAELLLPENVDGEAARKNNFRPDPNLPKGSRAENKDYVGTGFDRGHMAPAEDFRKNSVLMSQSFYLSNMVPQTPGLNRGIWRMLEAYVQNRVHNGETLYVITGPIFEGQLKTIGANHVGVPSHTFKVVINKATSSVDAFIIPNVDDPRGSYPDYRVPVQQVADRAHLNLMPNVRTPKN